MSTQATSPASLFGGTWTGIDNRFLLGASAAYTAGSRGGSSTVTLTASQMPTHSHRTPSQLVNVWAETSAMRTQDVYGTNGWGTGYGQTYSTTDAGGGSAHNNMPPYLAVYMWQRIE